MKFISFILLFFTLVTLWAQDQPGIHKLDSERFRKNLYKNSENQQKSEDIIPLNPSAIKDLSRAVFGYYPDWEYQSNAHLYFNYELLTHLAVFDFPVNENGQISEPWGWPWTNVVNDAHNAGVKVIMVITNFTAADIHNLITNSFTRWAFMVGVQSKIKEYQFDGVNIDFEGLNVADRGSTINDFMMELSDSVHSIDKELEVSYASPAVNWGGWDLYGLANSCDYLFIMGYDFYGSWSKNTGPTAPLTSSSQFNVTKTVISEYSTVTTFYPEKLILGVPYYGPHWTTQTSAAGSATTGWVGSERYRAAQPLGESKGIKWSNTFRNPWITFSEGSVTHQIWFDNDSSLGLKYDLAISRNLKGVGMWALGYDGARSELWNLLEEKFSIPVDIKKDENLIFDLLILNQNYPNPFNPVTTIKYAIPNVMQNSISQNDIRLRESNLNVTLKVYDILGRKVATLMNEMQEPGNYEVSFDGSEYPSGIYFYKLQAGNQIKIKKMTLIK